jgi:CubicO group peptidase (beta-lactamase class C family)
MSFFNKFMVDGDGKMDTKKVSLILSAAIVFLIGAWSLYDSKYSLAAKLDAYITAYAEQGLFSGSVLVAKDGKIVLCKGYGMANYEHDIANTAQTIFRLGSLSKQFTAMAIMQLQEKGLLNVNDAISKYIPDYPKGDTITIHHLLTHTAGIANFTDFPEYSKIKIESHTLEQLIEIIKNKPFDFSPGAKYQYSNSGYILLSYIIEKVSGKTYEAVIKENIFIPLGMYNSGYDHASPMLKNRASGYSMRNDEIVNADYVDMSVPSGAGALYSTVIDMYLWDRALYSTKLVSKESLAAIFKPQVPINSTTSYAYGWCVAKVFSQHTIIEHAGEVDGFSTDICRYPDDNLCVVVLSNVDNPAVRVVKISLQLAAIVFGEKYILPKKHVAIEVRPELYDQCVGQYKLSTADKEKGEGVITITKENNMLMAQGSGIEKLRIYPESETDFFAKSVDAQVSFVKDQIGTVIQLIWHQDGVDQVAQRV